MELGLVATAAAIISAPYLLPLIGIGDKVMAGTVAGLCSSTPGGLTRAVEGALGQIPGIGGWLASAGWGATLTSGVIGIAGVVLGDYIHRHYDRKGQIPWGRIVKYAALTTSMLIALPSILSGISMGLAYLAYSIGGTETALGYAKDILSPTLGFSGVPHDAPTGLAGLLPHLFTCGRALIPAGLTLFANHTSDATHGEKAGYSLRMVDKPLLIKGQPCELTFQLVDNETGRSLTEAEFETVHTRKLHTMIVDHSLTDYHHLHPEYDPARQLFVCPFTPQLQASYQMWNDFTVVGENHPTYLKSELSALRGLHLPPRITHTSHQQQGELNFHITPETPLRAGEDCRLRIDITDQNRRPVQDLEPIMGAFAHLIGFSGDGNHFIHSHPLGEEPTHDQARGEGCLQFHITPPAAGMSKFFLQVQRHGKIETVPFGQAIAPARTHTARAQGMQHHPAATPMAAGMHH